MKPDIILASGSRARSRILTLCRIPHRVIVSKAAEIHDQTKPPQYTAITNAKRKARAVAHSRRSGYVIGADTVVLAGKKLIGKPKSLAETRQMLALFTRKPVLVCTGLCIIDCKRRHSVTGYAMSRVKTQRLSRRDAALFVKLMKPHDKAGGFSVEGVGSFVFDAIEGSFYNIVGLPTITLRKLFRRLGLNLLIIYNRERYQYKSASAHLV